MGKQSTPDSVKTMSARIAMGLAELPDLFISAYEITDLKVGYCAPGFEPLAGTSFLKAVKGVKVTGGGGNLTMESVAALSGIFSLEGACFM